MKNVGKGASCMETLRPDRLSTAGRMRKPVGKSAVGRRGQSHVQVQSGLGGQA